MTLDEVNQLSVEESSSFFRQCCTSERWIKLMTAARPFENKEALYHYADASWADCQREDILEAFTGHPKIGDINSLKAKFANTQAMAGHEQSGTEGASETVLKDLAEGNRLYEERFGYIFIVCATGKSAAEMLALLQSRLPNAPEDELIIAGAEQQKITRIRLGKLLQ